jgi:hypothetical protein
MKFCFNSIVVTFALDGGKFELLMLSCVAG